MKQLFALRWKISHLSLFKNPNSKSSSFLGGSGFHITLTKRLSATIAFRLDKIWPNAKDLRVQYSKYANLHKASLNVVLCVPHLEEAMKAILQL